MTALLVGDAIEQMRLLPSRSADVFITDPPYSRAGALQSGRRATSGKSADAMGADQFWLYWFTDVARELSRVASRCGFVFCDFRTIHLVERAFADAGTDWVVSQGLVWDREHIGMGSPLRAAHEMAAFVRGPQFVWDGPKNVGNVWRCAWPYGAHEHHPAEKPVALLRRMVEYLTKPGEVVLDAFAGSGSTLVAAQQAGRSFIGIEANEAYVEVARHRLQQQPLGFDLGAAV